MRIHLEKGLLFTSIEISYKGISKVVENVVIDTGAAETIISPDIVEDIGIMAELNDTVNSFYGVGGSIQNF
jgi:predicted aspartyl protease